MAIRMLKIVLTIFVSLLGIFYATQNIVNFDTVYGFISAVASMEGANFYTNAFGPAITSPLLIYITMALIIAGEYLVGLLAAKGAMDMWKARAAKADAFNAAKKFAILGAGMALVVWFGFFTVIGGAYFQMWQTDLGSSSLEGAFQLVGSIGLVLLFINMKDE